MTVTHSLFNNLKALALAYTKSVNLIFIFSTVMKNNTHNVFYFSKISKQYAM